MPAVATLEFLETSTLALPNLQIPEIASNPAFAPIGDTVEFVVRRNDTLDRVFRQLQAEPAGSGCDSRPVPEVQKSLDLLMPGELITLVHADGLMQALSRRISDTQTLTVTRQDDGFSATVIETPHRIADGAEARPHRFVAVRRRPLDRRQLRCHHASRQRHLRLGHRLRA